MRLTIKNLGRLQSAEIDLDKQLTVFVGRNNTSKTYAAYTVYALHRFSFGLLVGILQGILKEKAEEIQDGGHWEFDTVQVFETAIGILGRNLRLQLPGVFAAAQDFVDRTEMTLQRSRYETDALVEAEARWATDGLTFQKVADSRFVTVTASQGTESKAKGSPQRFAAVATAGLVNIIREVLLSGGHTFALSTERTAIQLFYRELLAKRSEVVDAVLEKPGLEAVEQIQREARLYPLAIRDGLQSANRAASQKKVTSPFAYLADKLEALVGGAIKVDELGDLVFQPTGTSAPLGLQLASSSVKSLAGLSFYLRHIAEPGGFLLIDEPELNLHPDNQRKVARILTEMANAGLRVLITTHSDYLIRELNNLVLLHGPKGAELRAKHGYEESETIAPELLGAYLFDDTAAHPIDVAHTGIEVKTIDDEINSLNNISREIYFSLTRPPEES